MRYATTRFLPAVGLLGLILGTCGRAEAGFLFDSINADYLYPTQGAVLVDLGTQAVNPIALFNSFGQTNYGVSDTNIRITSSAVANINFLPAAFNGVSFTDVTADPGITGLVVNPATNLAGFDASRISFTSNTVFVNLQGLVTTPLTVVSLDVRFGATAVPEPPALALAGTGVLLALGCARRRRSEPAPNQTL